MAGCRFINVAPIVIAALLVATGSALAEPGVAFQDPLAAAMREGNWAEALDLARLRLKVAEAVPGDVEAALVCLQNLGRVEQADRLLERAADRHNQRPEMRLAISRAYGRLPAYGYEIAGEFRRGRRDNGGRQLNVAELDRVRRARLLRSVIEDDAAGEVLRAAACEQLAEVLLRGRGGRSSWRLQTLTDLGALPEPIEVRGGGGGFGNADSSAPPVNKDGSPVFYETPRTWDAAISDGERWRWAMTEAARLDESRRERVDLAYARFLVEQFGVQTLRGSDRSRPSDESEGPEVAPSLETLADNETIARLATGVRRFPLPPGHRFLELFERHGDWRRLAEIRLNRRQRAAAAHAYRMLLECQDESDRDEWIQQQIDQIVEPWALFEAQPIRLPGEEVTLRLRHRNADRISFTARSIDVPLLLADAKDAIEKQSQEAREKLRLERIGRRLVREGGDRYLGEDELSWTAEVDRGEDHADTVSVVKAPLRKAGAYFVTAKPAVDAAEVSVVVWVADTVLVKKPTEGGAIYAVLDAVHGGPIENAQLELFGYRFETTRQPGQQKRTREVVAERHLFRSDRDGLIEFGVETPDSRQPFQWLATVTTEDGRLAFLGFDSIWRAGVSDEPPRQPQTYLVTDRPAYRPGAAVNFKAWIGRGDYGSDLDAPASEYAHKAFQVALYEARGEKVASRSVTANLYGGLEGEFEIPEDAALGIYRIEVIGFGSGRFRVEEYRKPEFEVVVDAPDAPVRLGEAFEATVRASYFFGAPVEGARVRYRVSRTLRDANWIPVGRWDWLYGRGYGWLSKESPWRSDWSRWGCVCRPPWRPWRGGQPELVTEGESTLNENGEFRLEIDTRGAADRLPENDHQYTVTAEVTDDSRRTIDGAGKVLVARRPLSATVVLDRGHYEVGDTITATVSVRRPDGGPISQPGRLRLLRIQPSPLADTPPEKNAATPLPDPLEELVQEWDLASDAGGVAETRLKASSAGRYRLVFETEPVELGGVAQRVEAGTIFTIRGPRFDGAGFRFGALEIVPDKSEYQPGETARLLVNTDRIDSAVALFLRPVGGAYPKPRMLRLDGKSTLVEVPIGIGDQPNFYVEAMTVSEGRVHSAAQQIVVPPESRQLGVEVAPSASTYLPGQEGTLKVRLTDAAGEPVVGEATIAVYDRAVDAVAPDVAPGDIRQRFWSWRRRHRPSARHNLSIFEPPVAPPETPMMRPLGPFWGADGGSGAFAATARVGLAFGEGVVPLAAAPPALDADAESAFEGEPVLARSNFADTALWVGSVVTDDDGFAVIPIALPESLTAWRIRVWAVANGLRLGQAEAECVTRKNLMVRLQTPRFLVESDEAVLSALVRSELPTAQRVRVKLNLENAQGLELLDENEQSIRLDPDRQQRVDWRVRALRESEARIVAQAVSEPIEATGEATEANDAMRITLQIAVHGAEIVDSFSATLGPDDRLATFEINVPDRRRPEATRLDVRFTPTLVGAMVDALPYLIEYPHGCTEQTLNRFLPAVLTRMTLEDLGVDLADLRSGEGGPDEQPEADSPVFDPGELDRIVRVGVRKLLEMQLSDGGWGWFSGFRERSSAHTTALVVRGLRLARGGGVEVPDEAFDRGVAWLVRYRDEQLARLANCDDDGRPIDEDRPYKRAASNLDALAHLVLSEAGNVNADYRDRLFADRLGLMPYGQAMLGVALHLESEASDAEDVAALRDRVARNLMQFVVKDDELQTASLNLPGGVWWRWYGSEYEAHAFFLKLLVATDPDGDLAPRVVKHLLDSRRSARRWNSTRDTALVVEALGEYAVATREAGPRAAGEPTRVEVWLDGQRRQTTELSASEALRGAGVFALRGEELSAGRHTLELRKQGGKRLYAAATLANFSLEPDLRAAGLELRVERRLHRLKPIVEESDTVDSRGGALRTPARRYQRIAAPNLGSIRSGELLEVELNLLSKNDYEYLVIEDPKPAGCEPIDARSGYNGNELGAYAEFRDRAARFYVARLPRGEHTLRYRMRVETPGEYSALPTSVEAMYAPELRGNSDELKLKILETPDD